MTPWDDQYVRDLVDELESRGKISSAVAERARTAADAGRYTEALDVALDRASGMDPVATSGGDAALTDPPRSVGRASED